MTPGQIAMKALVESPLYRQMMRDAQVVQPSHVLRLPMLEAGYREWERAGNQRVLQALHRQHFLARLWASVVDWLNG